MRLREAARSPLARHWVLVEQGAIVADVYDMGAQGFTVIVRAHSTDRLTGPRVLTLPTLDAAFQSFAGRWSR